MAVSNATSSTPAFCLPPVPVVPDAGLLALVLVVEVVDPLAGAADPALSEATGAVLLASVVVDECVVFVLSAAVVEDVVGFVSGTVGAAGDAVLLSVDLVTGELVELVTTGDATTAEDLFSTVATVAAVNGLLSTSGLVVVPVVEEVLPEVAIGVPSLLHWEGHRVISSFTRCSS